jgi:GLPGLI family protein
MRIPLVILLWSIVSAVVGQKRLSEGSLSFSVLTYQDNKRIGDSLTAQHFFKGAHTRTDLVGRTGKTTTFYDSREELGAIVRDFGSQKILIPLDATAWADKNAWYNPDNIIYLNEQLTILNYPCSKARINLRNGDFIHVWYTTAVVLDNKDTEFQMGDLPGLVLSYEFQKGATKVIYMGINLNFDPVPIQRFDIPSSGYRILSYAESKKEL